MIQHSSTTRLSNNDARIYDVQSDLVVFPKQWFLIGPLDAAGEEIDSREFTEGRPYTGAPPAKVLIRQSGAEVAFHLGAFEMPVVSSTVARIIQAIAPGDVQCFPVEIPGAAGSFQILNAVWSLDCLDESRSEFTRWQPGDHRTDLIGRYRMISTIRIDPTKTAGHQLFRIKNWTVALLVSGAVKDALAEVPLLGVKFYPAS